MVNGGNRILKLLHSIAKLLPELGNPYFHLTFA